MDYLNQKYNGKRVLITGHTGFKGSWLSLWLSTLGAKVVGYALEPPTEPNLFTELNLGSLTTHVIGDIRDQEHLLNTVEKYKPEYVFHLAAQPLVILSYEEPKLTYETNVMGTINILESIRMTDFVKSCIIVTSDKCYENKEWIYGYREIDPLGGYDPYSSSKACVELVTGAYLKSFFNPQKYGNSNTTCISSARSGNVIGGGDWNKNRILTDCVTNLSQGKSINIRNPKATRPWQYVLESLYGYLLLGATGYDSPDYSGAWNFGPHDNSVITVENLVKLVIYYWGSGNYLENNSNHTHESGLLKLDSSKAHSYLNWSSIYNINETIKKTIEWYKAYYNGTRGKELYELTVKEIKDYELAQGGNNEERE